ncbi:pilus assembly protein TadD [Vibrio sp. S9_S30]|uniref:tetratricopeptide repeat protein n=1 Tax=Vibrio sp. S9_S30 TaxID=2720226 RepID=UPI0016806B1D|nr:tetratricopeptide repeat protein [Vibrio sp. S9_S30]MBD1556167.1 pilus assembly protein TadD [Vibrio sp. S9_S30]
MRLLLGIMVVLLTACTSTRDHAEEKKSHNYQAMAEAAFNYSQYDRAEHFYVLLTEEQPDDAHYQVMLARSLYLQDKKQAAIARLQKMAYERASSEAALYLGKYHLKGGDYVEGEKAYRSGLSNLGEQSKPSIEGALHNGLGAALVSQRQFKEGVGHFEKATQIEPDNATYRSNLSLAWLTNGETEKAREVFTPLLSYKNLSPRVEMNFALILLAENREEEARNILARHMTKNQVDKDIAKLKRRSIP